MKQQELMREVETVITERLADGKPTPMTWLVTEVLNRHQDIAGADVPFFQLCGYEHVRDTVREVFRLRKGNEAESEAQADLFPGYTHVQRSYTISRDGEQMVVRLEQMTADEIRSKASELRGFAMGAMAHARELDEYLKEREGKAAQAS
jgi:hypothetical protein